MTETLFNKSGRLSDYLQQERNFIANHIDTFELDYLLPAHEEELVNALVLHFRIDPIMLELESIHQYEPQDTAIDISHRPEYRTLGIRNVTIPGTSITVAIPFSGDGDLLHYRPGTHTTHLPRGEIAASEIQLTYRFAEEDPGSFQKQVESDIDELKQYVEWLNRDITVHNESLQTLVWDLTKRRKKKLLKDRELGEALGFPLRKRTDAPETFAVPLKRKRAAVRQADPIDEKQTAPEAYLEQDDYENILIDEFFRCGTLCRWPQSEIFN